MPAKESRQKEPVGGSQTGTWIVHHTCKDAGLDDHVVHGNIEIAELL
jgi:hypothetical protein